MIRLIAFDLGNVLYRFDPLLAARGLVAAGGVSLEPLEVVRFFEQSEKEKMFCEGKISSQDFFQHVSDELRLSCAFDVFARAFCDIFHPMHQCFQMVRELKEQGYPLFLLSNTNELHFNFLFAKDPILTLFDERILSYEVKCQKPDARIFQILIDRAEFRPEEILFIDDLQVNTKGANQLGIETHWFRNATGLRQDLVKRELL